MTTKERVSMQNYVELFRKEKLENLFIPICGGMNPLKKSKYRLKKIDKLYNNT